MNTPPEKGLGKHPRGGEEPSDPVADLARRLLRENTLLRDEVDRLNEVLRQYKKCS